MRMLEILAAGPLALALALPTPGRGGYRARYRREVEHRLARLGPLAPPITDADLAALPDPVRRYVRRTGAAGRPRPRHLRAAWRGRIRSGPHAPWMAFTAEQHDFVDEPARFFLMRARRGGLPVTVYHEFAGEHASMGARLLSVVPVMRLEGPDARRAETVTVMNDLCILAAGALVHPSFAWEPIDAVSARARYTAPPYTVASTLRFSERGELIDFVSDDRLEATPEGLVPRRWSTPLRDYRAFGPLSAASRGEGRWHGGDGGYSYIELELLELEVD